MFSILRFCSNLSVLMLAGMIVTTEAQGQPQSENPAVAIWNSLKPAQPPVEQRQAQARPQNTDSPYRRQMERANENTISIISGNPNGSYLTIAYDFSAVLDKPDGLRVLPILGKGATQNVRDVLFLRGVDMGLMRSNTLSYYRDGKEIPGLQDKIVYIARLFNEELHIYAREEIKSLQDLEGKHVNFSDIGSGTQFTAQQVFKALGIKPVEVNMGQADGIEAMRRNEIAATVLEAGKPSRVYSELKPGDGFHFLPVDYAQALEEEYYPAELTHEDYPQLIAEGQTVDTIATAAILIAYNWPTDTDRYKRLVQFTDQFFENFAEFRKAPRHPKWAEVSLMAEVPGMKRFAPATKWLQDNAPKPEPEVSSEEERLRQEFSAFLSTSGDTGSDGQAREKLFKQFLEWRRGASDR